MHGAHGGRIRRRHRADGVERRPGVIPETGKEGLDWIADAQDAGNTFVAGAAIVVVAGLFGLVAFLGFSDTLRQAGPLMIIAPVAGAAGMVLVTISHATPIALALDLAPRVTEATGASKESLEATFDTLARFCLVMNYFGDVLVWGVTTPLYAVAILKTKVAPTWVGGSSWSPRSSPGGLGCSRRCRAPSRA